MACRDPVQRQEADVVAVARVLAAGIAKANKEFHVSVSSRCRARLISPALTSDTALQAALQLRFAGVPVVAAFVAVTVGGLAAVRAFRALRQHLARRLRRRETERREESHEGDLD